MKGIVFERSEDIDGETGAEIHAGLIAFNDSKVEKSAQRNLLIAARDPDGLLLGGIKGYTLRGWLYIHQLWVEETARSTGLGSMLLKLAEDEGCHRGCIGAYLNTYSFQALEFYKKNGFEVFGELHDFPKGYKNIFLKKALSGSTSKEP